MAITILLTLAVLTGLALLTRGLRGRRIDDHPICRRCRFDLVGVYPASQQCPECGTMLEKPRSLRRGNRRKRRGLMAAGTALLLPALLVAAAVLAAAIAGYDLNRIKPVPWLLYDLRAADVATSDAAIIELNRRLVIGDLKNATASRIIEITLDRQAAAAASIDLAATDFRSKPMKLWFDFFDAAAARDLVTEDQILRAARQAFQLQPRSRIRTPSGSQLIVTSALAFRPFSEQNYGTLTLDLDFHVGDHALVPDEHLRDIPSNTVAQIRGGSGWYHRPVVDLPPGEYELEITYTARIHAANYDPNAGGPPAPVRAEWQIVRRLPLTVTAPDAPIVELVSDPAIGKQLEGLYVYKNTIDFSDGGSVRGTIQFDGHLPIPLYCSISLKTGDEERPAGHMYWERTASTAGFIVLRAIDDLPDTVDLILEPAPHAAASNTTLTQIWGEPIIFRNVKVIGHTPPPAEASPAQNSKTMSSQPFEPGTTREPPSESPGGYP